MPRITHTTEYLSPFTRSFPKQQRGYVFAGNSVIKNPAFNTVSLIVLFCKNIVQAAHLLSGTRRLHRARRRIHISRHYRCVFMRMSVCKKPPHCGTTVLSGISLFHGLCHNRNGTLDSGRFAATILFRRQLGASKPNAITGGQTGSASKRRERLCLNSPAEMTRYSVLQPSANLPTSSGFAAATSDASFRLFCIKNAHPTELITIVKYLLFRFVLGDTIAPVL